MNALTLVIEAAAQFGDPNFTRVFRADWLVFLNSVCRDVSARLRCVEYIATADVVASQGDYIYPSDMVQVRFIRYTDGAGDPWDLEEMPLDEWRRRTDRVDVTNVPDSYVPRQNFLTLVPRPSSASKAGLIMHYWGVCADVTDLTTQSIQLPDFMAEYIKRGMQPYAKRKDKEFEEAAALEALWRQEESEMRTAIEDRARDRRPSLRPRDLHRPTRGQV